METFFDYSHNANEREMVGQKFKALTENKVPYCFTSFSLLTMVYISITVFDDV